ncbi:hypothetical protein BU23DRAFT_579235 [Bimuria novae-zelandiae CBS 107.79]|uniref:Uncharacterized protein n=1 Tax=Bimuria novae-zelandiae CBS 107.79 TaxID=1447943 RepID=A0A6A5VJL1_9PLEO|nr:hypothetical protein BU23DRAFT_579235 [Bimuria novae-zelandiae CBS 107.79]
MLRERNMISIMNKLTDKPEWTRKVHDKEIVSNWKKEAIDLFKDEPPEKQFSEKMFDYCIEELRDYAKMQEECGFTPALDADATVYKSDTVVSSELRDDLRAAVAPLENVEEKDKDWHPDSDEKVLDLVHPSLFPLLYGRSRVLKPEYGHVLGDSGQWEGKSGNMSLDDCEFWIGKGGIMPVPEVGEIQIQSGRSSWGSRGEQHFYSANFQWLPCEVAFAGNDAVNISSYINNLQPKKHQQLYQVLERVIARAIPMWNATLHSTDYLSTQPRIVLDDYDIPWIEPEGERERGQDEDSDGVAADEFDEEWRKTHRTLVPPEPASYSTRKTKAQGVPVDLRKDFADQGLQIIVKLANIHLTPEKPDYEGGSWHIEGQENEHICASALYYYDSENITDSYLSFREGTSTNYLDTKPYEQDDHTHFERLYGITSWGPAVQELGSVFTREGRLLTFSNVLQHRVSPFSLADKTRPGHRKILALFLVDPCTRIPSTANVPPQQKEWWADMVQELDRIAKLPVELREWVINSVGDFPIELEEAKALRLKLMDERRMFVADHETRLRQETFNFCEH